MIPLGEAGRVRRNLLIDNKIELLIVSGARNIDTTSQRGSFMGDLTRCGLFCTTCGRVRVGRGAIGRGCRRELPCVAVGSLCWATSSNCVKSDAISCFLRGLHEMTMNFVAVVF